MTGRARQPNPCNNMNHRRTNAPVGHCPQCGGVVNDRIRVAPCSEPQHAVARRHQSAFCVDCGVQLILSR
jgi:hypothetical protein